MGNVLKIVELYLGSHEATYGELREFVRLTAGNPHDEKVLYGFTDDEIDSLKGLLKEA